MALAVPLYTVGVALLVATALFGITKKGATRWLNVGVVIQPSEILKIAMPLMLAWWFQKREGQLRRPISPSPACCCWCRWAGGQAARPGHGDADPPPGCT
jgi:cell division protein FtsW (lipid II flippase)